ncbi:MAG: cupin domain-containing protein [Chitinophagaceae bacterium]
MQLIKQAPVRKRVFVNPIYKDKATVLESCEETGGDYSLGELEIFPGGGNHLHVHNAFEETFTSVKGILGVMYKDRKIYLKPGESITVPGKTPHHFFNDGSEPVICHIRFVPGHEGFEKGLAIGYGLATDGKTNKKGVPKSLTHLALLITLTDTRPAEAMGLLMPVFRWMANSAIKRGVEKELLARYYYKQNPLSFLKSVKTV